MDLKAPVETIKNVGEKRKELLNKVGIYTVRDLIEYIPRDYADRSRLTPLCDVKEGEEYTVRAKMKKKPEMTARGRVVVVRGIINDGTGEAVAVWFNRGYLRNTFDMSKEYYFTGVFENRMGRLTLTSPDFEEVRESEAINAGRIVPVYHLTKKLNQKLLRKLIYDCLESIEGDIEEFMPYSVRRRYGLCGRAYALKNIHFPESRDAFFAARRRLVFEELFILRLRLLNIKKGIKKQYTGLEFSFFETDRIIGRFPFRLTSGQEEALEEIIEDMSQKHPMNRLIQGDVGSGKTAVAQVCAYIAYINGAQTAVMAPTDVLATQHYISFCELFEGMGISVVLLKGSMSAKEKRETKRLIADGEAHIVIGTHTLIQSDVVFKELGLVITDEQHRFGVNQRGLLTAKGTNPHTLIMSATPIPRTLGLILYGDLDITTIKTMPAGRKKIDTSFVDSSYHERIYNFIYKHVKQGRQAYIVCPVIEENDKTELKSVKEYFRSLEGTPLRELNTAIVHGRMKAEEKQRAMDDFAAGKTDVLVATTVIEVGINVANANIMLIENAERYGLSQLHQLRGRVGRGEHQSYCILVSDKKDKTVRDRLKTMVKSADGFELSEKDLMLRGPGEFFGVRQHGLPELKIANLYKDMDILREADDCVSHIEELSAEEYGAIIKRIGEIYDFDNKNVTF